MTVAIVGGHGKIARHLTQLLHADGQDVIGIIRNPQHQEAIRALGGEPRVVDVEHAAAAELAEALTGADAVVFAAGAGPGSGSARKLTVDRDGAILAADAAEQAGVRRLLVVSSIGADDADPDSDDVFQVYLRAKAAADAAIRERELDWTIVRPGPLTDADATGRVEITEHAERRAVTREDVARVLFELLRQGTGVRRQFELVGGYTPVIEAVSALH